VTIHPAARGFAGVTAAYERGRPEYPHELLEWLAGRGRVGVGSCIVDLGAGTGKLTRLLVGHGARVLAVEPIPEMRAGLEAVVPQAEVVAGTAESIPLGSGTADLLICGQSFHWFANERAVDEIARVLKPGGELVLVWNTRDSTDPLQQQLAALIDRFRGETPSQSTGAWRAVMDSSAVFVADGELTATTEQLVDRAGLLDRVESTSFVAALTGPTRAELLAEVATLAPQSGRVALRYVTQAYAYRRRGGMMVP
jgi:SAM-dependent methyltransferase